MKLSIPSALALLTISCSSFPFKGESVAERYSTYSYIPLDPIPVQVTGSCSSRGSNSALLHGLPDQAVRMAIGEYDASGNISFGPVAVSGKDKSYIVTLDYVSVDSVPREVFVQRIRKPAPNISTSISTFFGSFFAQATTSSPGFEYRVSTRQEDPIFDDRIQRERISIPIYVGVGLRVTASLRASEGGIKLTSLGAISAAAQAQKISGTLTVQTLGVTGQSVATSLPLPSELNETTVQNAILSLGAIKAVLYDSQNTVITPRVVGIHNPIGSDPNFINSLISVLSEKPVIWPCR